MIRDATDADRAAIVAVTRAAGDAARPGGAAWMVARLGAYDPSLRGRVVFPPSFG